MKAATYLLLPILFFSKMAQASANGNLPASYTQKFECSVFAGKILSDGTNDMANARQATTTTKHFSFIYVNRMTTYRAAPQIAVGPVAFSFEPAGNTNEGIATVQVRGKIANSNIEMTTTAEIGAVNTSMTVGHTDYWLTCIDLGKFDSQGEVITPDRAF